MAFDAYLKFEGGPKLGGESDRKGHEGEIAILAFSFGASNPATISGGTKGSAAGKGVVSAFTVNKTSDTSSAILFQACMKGDHFPKATVTLNKAGGDAHLPYLIYEFEEVYISSFQMSGSSGGDDRPMETMNLDFGKVKVTYSAQTETGAAGEQIIGQWNVRTQTPD
ncbi:Hcp family type VI secretion system effector [Gaopeijia maritima]|uniref:Type VI secretion system tube protein Hcp n=1 Tax=Gaopeijia maritima TaxID=3119007 RepID=A0ABU9EER4_9BACT